MFGPPYSERQYPGTARCVEGFHPGRGGKSQHEWTE